MPHMRFVLAVLLAVAFSACRNDAQKQQVPAGAPETVSTAHPGAQSKEIATKADFETSEFCRKYQCREGKAWRLKAGGTNHTYETNLNSALTDVLSVEIQTDGPLVKGIGLMFFERDRLRGDDFEIVECLLRSVNQDADHKAAMAFIRQHVERRVHQIDEAPSFKDGQYRIRAAKVFPQQTISVERIAA